MYSHSIVRFRRPLPQAIWNMRWPAVFICGPMFGLIMVAGIFGLPRPLWLLGGGFFLFSCLLFAVLVNGEVRHLRRRESSR